MAGLLKKIFVPLMMLLVAGCGGGENAFVPPGGTSGGVTGQPTISLALTDSNGASTTSIAVDRPGTLRATVRDGLGNPVSGAVVTFSTTLATFNPTAGSVLTNSSGVGTISLLAGTTTGADTVTADVSVNGTDATASLGYTVAAPSVSLSALSIGTSPLSANGTTSLTVTVLDGAGAPYTTPVAVAFASNCSAIDKATIGSPITTINGVATSNYLDKGCANTDTVTASLTLGGTTLSSSANLVVQPASAGSIQFISANPETITLKGTGGAGLQETSTVTFRVVDPAGNSLSGATVNFTLSTTVGGLDRTPGSGSTDANGEVSTVVSSGAVATAVRVIASVANTTLQTQSDQLTVSTGVAAQDHFSLAASTHAIEGWDVDGVTSTISVILSDHFSNPVPNGTAVNFIAEGAQIGSSCTTVDGTCNVTFKSANLRLTNGRVSILAYGIGEEGFTDMDGDGYVSSNAERVDANNVSTDMGEAWVDYDESGFYELGEPFIDFSPNGIHDSGDGLYNGVLCKSGNTWCSSTKNINVRRQDVIVLSGSSAVIKASDDLYANVVANPNLFNPLTPPSGTRLEDGKDIQLSACVDGTPFTNTPKTVLFQITDERGNTMPAGTTISASVTNGTIENEGFSSPIPDNTACVHGDDQFKDAQNNDLCPANADKLEENPGFVVLLSDATQSTDAALKCTNAKKTGTLTITVTSPKGLKTIKSYDVLD